MDLTISPYRYSIKSRPAFKAHEKDPNDAQKHIINETQEQASNNSGCATISQGCLAGLFLLSAVVGTPLAITLPVVYESEKNQKIEQLNNFSKQLDSVAQNGVIRNDTFTVNDANKDKYPDITFYKQNGGKVIINCKDLGLLEEDMTFKEID